MPIRLGLVLLSGGLDSTTLATFAVSRDYQLSALTLDYGQTHRRELAAATEIAKTLGIEQIVADVSFYKYLAQQSALTNADTYDLPTGRSQADMADDIPITITRNTLPDVSGRPVGEPRLREIEQNAISPEDIEATLFVSQCGRLQLSGLPTRVHEIAVETLNRGSKLCTQYGIPFKIDTPLIEMSKADIVRMASELTAPIHLSWSCYRGSETPCGECDSCLLRAKGFAQAGLPDPALP